jgi:hypothetical protein
MKLVKNYKFRCWLAGFFDGEGTVSVKYEKPSGTHKSPVIYPYIGLSNTNKKVIDLIISLFPTQIKITKYRPNERCKPVYRLEWTKNHAIMLLKLIKPYLIIKTEQARLCINLLRTYYNKRNIKKGTFKRVSKIIMKKRIKIFQRIRKLNHRGAYNPSKIIYHKHYEPHFPIRIKKKIK